jgi:hypothetical protein
LNATYSIVYQKYSHFQYYTKVKLSTTGRLSYAGLQKGRLSYAGLQITE